MDQDSSANQNKPRHSNTNEALAFTNSQRQTVQDLKMKPLGKTCRPQLWWAHIQLLQHIDACSTLCVRVRVRRSQLTSVMSRDAAAALMCKLGCRTELLQSSARAKVPTALKEQRDQRSSSLTQQLHIVLGLSLHRLIHKLSVTQRGKKGMRARGVWARQAAH